MFKKVILPILALAAVAGVRHLLAARITRTSLAPASVKPAREFAEYANAESGGGVF